jgi:hypothetical protein
VFGREPTMYPLLVSCRHMILARSVHTRCRVRLLHFFRGRGGDAALLCRQAGTSRRIVPSPLALFQPQAGIGIELRLIPDASSRLLSRRVRTKAPGVLCSISPSSNPSSTAVPIPGKMAVRTEGRSVIRVQSTTRVSKRSFSVLPPSPSGRRYTTHPVATP